VANEGCLGVPWYVKRSAANAAKLAEWDFESVDLELVQAKGGVNSLAPGGVEPVDQY
jgi:hypothetical protein